MELTFSYEQLGVSQLDLKELLKAADKLRDILSTLEHAYSAADMLGKEQQST